MEKLKLKNPTNYLHNLGVGKFLTQDPENSGPH